MGRDLGRSGIDVSEIGFGCWAIGGPVTLDGRPDGWGAADDDESVAALRRGLELGVTFFDTADVYGAGHSERVLRRALAGHRDEVVIATKFGYTFDTGQRAITGEDATPAYIHRACRASLRRLGTDRIDLYQLHLGELSVGQAQDVAGTLDGLVADGLIRAYGWSTDDPQRAAAFAGAAHCAAIQHELNALADAPAMLAACDALDLASIDRSPLAMGMLTGIRCRLAAAHRRRACRPAVGGLLHRWATGAVVAGPARCCPRGAVQRWAHAGPGRAVLAAGTQLPHGAHPRRPDCPPGRAERRSAAPRAAAARGDGRDHPAAWHRCGPASLIRRTSPPLRCPGPLTWSTLQVTCSPP